MPLHRAGDRRGRPGASSRPARLRRDPARARRPGPDGAARRGRRSEQADPRLRAEVLPLLLDDPVRAVRLEAARALAPVSPQQLSAERRTRLDAAFAEYEAAQSTLLDRPEGLITLANFYRDRGRLADAEARLADSIRLHPSFVPAYANLADLLRQQGRDPGRGAHPEAGLGDGTA